MPTLQALPDEILLRIIDEISASGFGHSNPVYSLPLTSKFLHSLCLPYLYRSVTISSFRQLVRFLSKDGSRAWDVGPNAGMRDLWINAAYIDERFLFMPRNQRRSIQRDLAALVKQSPFGLESLHIRVVPLDVGLWDESPTPFDLFRVFVSCVQARRIECTTANSLPAYEVCLEDEWHHGGDMNVDNQTGIEHLRMPFLSFSKGDQSRIPAFCQQHRLKSLRLDWPRSLHSSIVAEMLVGLQDTLQENGLIIDAPASEIPSDNESSQFLAEEFKQENPILSLTGIRSELAKKHEDVEALMKKLDWRVPDLKPVWDGQVSSDTQRGNDRSAQSWEC